MIQETLDRISAGQDLSFDEMASAMDSIMQGRWQNAQIAAFLLSLRAKGETVEEVAGAARAMRRNMTPISTERTDLLDTCGTGGDGSGTFNISTAAALVASAAGAAVAKHGNRGITSKTGSADVLAALGVNVDASVSQVQHCLDDLGICFCFAPLMHPAMRHVGQVRRSLGVPSIFNILGPLCNPAAAPYQLLGVGRPPLRNLLAQALILLETHRAVVVCGEDGLDEVTLDGVTHVTDTGGGTLHELDWEPGDFGLEAAGKEMMQVSGPESSAAMIRAILAGQSGPPRDIVVINAAAALWTVGVSDDLRTCAQRVIEALDRGDAQRQLEQLARLSHQT